MKYLAVFTIALVALSLSNGFEFNNNNNNNQIAGLVVNEWVTIKSLNSQKCLSVAQGTIKQFGCNSNDNNQKWKIEVNTQKGAPWVTVANANGKVLDNQMGSTNKMTKYWSHVRNGTPAQNFKIQKSPQGHWFLRNERSNLCLDLMNWGKNDGGELIQWDCLSNQANQNWIIERISTLKEAPKNNNSGKRIGTENQQKPSTNNGQNNAQNNQQKPLTNNGQNNYVPNQGQNNKHHHQAGELDNGYFQIKNPAEKCLKDVGVGLPLSFSDCNDVDDGIFFKFKRSKKDKAYYIFSALGNSVSYKSGSLLSAFLKQDKSQKFRITEKNDSGIFKFKTLEKKCITSENGLSLTPCKKKTPSQRLALYAFTKIFVKK